MRARTARAFVLSELGETKAALADFDLAIRAAPKDAVPLYYRGEALINSGDLDGAARDFETAIKLEPKLPDAYLGRGKLKLLREQKLEAIADMTKAIALRPAYAMALMHRGLAYASLGDTQASERDLNRAAELAPHLNPTIDEALAKIPKN